MKFQHTAKIDAPIEAVWDWLMDVPRVAQCMPGVDSVEPLGDDKFRGTIKVSIGTYPTGAPRRRLDHGARRRFARKRIRQ